MRRFTEMMGRESGLVGATAWNALPFSPAMQMVTHEPHSMLPAQCNTHFNKQTMPHSSLQEGPGVYRAARRTWSAAHAAEQSLCP